MVAKVDRIAEKVGRSPGFVYQQEDIRWYSSSLQFDGFPIRYPVRNSCNRRSVAVDGYGVPPKVTIS